MRYSFFLSALALLFFCNASSASAELALIAEANFDTDTIGELPDPSLPGGPAGDNLSMTGIGTVANYTVESSVGGLDAQPMRAERSSGSGSFNFALNIPSTEAADQELVTRFHFSPIASPYVFVILRGPNLAVHGSLYIAGTNVYISSSNAAQSVVKMGLTANEDHVFQWSFNRTTGVQTLILDGETLADNLDTTFEFNSAKDVTGLYFEGSGSSAMQYALDEIQIYSGTGTPTPTAASSWGKMKAVYEK